MRKIILMCLVIPFFIISSSKVFALSFEAIMNFRADDGPSSVTAGDFNQDGKIDLAAVNSISKSISILLGIGNGTFMSPVNYFIETFNSPELVKSADFNNDGKIDILVLDSYNKIRIFLGNGDVTFNEIEGINLNHNIWDLVLKDFNKDGKIDIVYNKDFNIISILLGNGDGTFYEVSNYSTDGHLNKLISDDFNGDGKADIAFTKGYNNISILFGNNDGTFGEIVNNSVPDNPFSLISDDFNGDEKIDIVFNNVSTGYIYAILGNGDGTFSTPVFNYNSPPGLTFIEKGDFNSDNKIDLAILNKDCDNILILLGNGDGTFNPSDNYIVGAYSQMILPIDLNSDSKTDLVVANYLNYISVLLGKGDGTFITAKHYNVGDYPVSIEVADFNRDSKVDIITANKNYTGQNSISILFGKGDGKFNNVSSYATGNIPQSIIVEDFNKDGNPDFAFTDLGNNKVSVQFGIGDGTFNPIFYYYVGPAPSLLKTEDFNKDGYPDLAVLNYGVHAVTVLINYGNGIFKSPFYYEVDNPISLTTGDYNKDGKTDIAITTENQNISILLNNGDGTFKSPLNYYIESSRLEDLTTEDFNNDSNPDLAIANTGEKKILILLGNGDGTFQKEINCGLQMYPTSLVTGDFNKDGKSDIAVIGEYSNNISLLTGNGDGTFTKIYNYNAGGSPTSLITGDFNGDNKLDIAVANGFNNYVTILINTTPQYNLNLAKSGTGMGTVTSEPSGINCEDDCSESFGENINITLTATPETNSIFEGWSGDCSSCGTNPVCTILIDADKNCIASFNIKTSPDYYTLTVSKTGDGNGVITSKPAGINCGEDCTETYSKTLKPKNVILKATPDSYSTFLGWGGDCQYRGTKTTCILKMDSDKNVTANFGRPDISISPDSYDFGNIAIKQSSSPVTFAINNKGTGNLKIKKLRVIGTDAKMFKTKGNCQKTILPDSTCQFTVTFKPTSAGIKNAILEVISNDPDTATLDIQLTGNGI